MHVRHIYCTSDIPQVGTSCSLEVKLRVRVCVLGGGFMVCVLTSVLGERAKWVLDGLNDQLSVPERKSLTLWPLNQPSWKAAIQAGLSVCVCVCVCVCVYTVYFMMLWGQKSVHIIISEWLTSHVGNSIWTFTLMARGCVSRWSGLGLMNVASPYYWKQLVTLQDDWH